MVSTETKYLGDPNKLTSEELEQNYKKRLEFLQKKVDKLRREGAQDLFLDELLQMEQPGAAEAEEDTQDNISYRRFDDT